MAFIIKSAELGNRVTDAEKKSVAWRIEAFFIDAMTTNVAKIDANMRHFKSDDE